MLHLSWRGHQTCTPQGTARLRAHTKRTLGLVGRRLQCLGLGFHFFLSPVLRAICFGTGLVLERHPNPCISLHGLYFLSLPACPMSPFTAQETKLAKIAAWQPGTYTHGSLSLVTKFLPAPQRVLATPLESVESTHILPLQLNCFLRRPNHFPLLYFSF